MAAAGILAATQSLKSKNPIASSYLGNEEGRLGAAAISVISMQGDKATNTAMFGISVCAMGVMGSLEFLVADGFA